VPEREIDYPIAGWLFEEPIPDLDELPTEGWRAVLAPLSGRTRTWAMRPVADMDRRIAAETFGCWRRRSRSSRRSSRACSS